MTAAAELMRISQPALSRQIKDLEEEIGQKLFDRSTRGKALELTAAGRIMFRRAQEIIALADRTSAEIRAGENIEGDVHIAAAQSVGMRLIARAAVAVHERYPGVIIHLHDGNGPDIMERLENGLADFAVIVQPVDMARFEHLPLPGADSMGLLMRKDHPLATHDTITSSDLDGVPLLVPRGVLSRGDLSGWLGRSGIKLDIVGTMNLSYNSSQFVREGYGCAVCFDGLVDVSKTSDLRFRPFEPSLTAGLAFAWKRSQPLSPACEAMLEALQQVIAAKQQE